MSQTALVAPQLKHKIPVRLRNKQGGSESRQARGMIADNKSAAAGAEERVQPSARLFIS